MIIYYSRYNTSLWVSNHKEAGAWTVEDTNRFTHNKLVDKMGIA